MRRRCIEFALVAAFGCALPATARADCENDLKVLAPQVQGLTDAGEKRRAERYMLRALRELDEGDEMDCVPAAEAVRSFLARRDPPSG